MTLFVYKCILFWCVVVVLANNEERCPSKCICKRGATLKDDAEFLKMKCGENEKVLHLDEVELLDFAAELVQLNLSDNHLKSFSPKVELIVLQKLDVSRNLIKELKENQFIEAPNLKKLDLTGNRISYIHVRAFEGLNHLEKLKLSHNEIATIQFGTLDPLIRLKQLDISNNPLQCDCGLLWLLDWNSKLNFKLLSNPKCSSPFEGQPLRKLKIGVDIHCESVHSSIHNIIEFQPNENQVVFEGDKLVLKCKAPSISDKIQSKIEWTWLESDPKLYFPDIMIETHSIPSKGLIESTLSISRLKRNHTGIWSCVFSSLNDKDTKSITIVVISDATKYCPMTVSSNNKGTYNWPRTIINYTVSIPCESLNLNYDISTQMASYFCSREGEWTNLDTSMCSYISDTTKILEQFSKVNTSVLESAKHFKNYTSNLNIFKDPVDFMYAVKTIENYLKSPASDILMDIINNLITLPKSYLRKAEIEFGSCTKLVEIMENLALNSSSILQKSNVAIEMFQIKKEGFSGLKCTWYVNPNNRHDSIFSCSSNNLQETIGIQEKITEASITIPESLFYQLQEEQDMFLMNKIYRIMVSVQTNSNFFPMDDARYGREEITSVVIGTKLADVMVTNLTEPVYVMLRTPKTTVYEVTPFQPVWWDPRGSNGSGGWSSDGCRFNREFQDHLVFSCRHFGYYGLMQDVSFIDDVKVEAKFKLSHPAIYVGSIILFGSFLVVILTYLMCYNSIQMPKKAKHSLVNLWASICLLCFMYSFGIYQTEDVKVCQIVGMILHYFTLCSLLWMCVGVNCMYKRLSKNDVIGLQEDDLPSDQPIQKPILGLYLVGWGIALIICGLSAAINMKEYASNDHCFLRPGPALSALYVPFIVLILFLCVMFLLIRCAIYNLDTNGHLSEGTQATEHVDLDLLEPSLPNENCSVQSVSSSETEDSEHAPSSQLKAYIIFLLIYIVTWLSCAFATRPVFNLVPYEEDLFSIAYAILSTTLSAFTLFFYCVARNDVRNQWTVMCRLVKRKKCFRARHITDAAPPNVPQIQIQPLPLPPVSNRESQVLSRSSSRSSSRTKSNSHASNILKGAVDLNGSFSDNQGAKINNVNLVVLHRAQYRSNLIPNIIENPTNAAEVFYNPHQSTVARKFFKRQRKHMMKKNNIIKPPRDINSDTASVFSEPKPLKNRSNFEQNIFGTNSKVNNTNIHVEQIKKVQKKNPNIFSDSGDEFDSMTNVPVENIVMNAERLRKRELLRHKNRKKPNIKSPERSDNNMRSVSQQCTLEYSSENLSDSILDKTSPEKSLLPIQDSFLTENIEPAPSVRRENSLILTDDSNYAKIREAPSIIEKNKPKIYINPSHGFSRLKCNRSGASTASVSDLDELYQQIRRGPRLNKRRHIYSTIAHASPCLSDSEVNSFVESRKTRTSQSYSNLEWVCDDVETTV